MAELSKLPPEDQKLIISLPYRVGMWVSHVDDVESRKADDKQERQVLELAISRMGQQAKKMPFAALVAQQIGQAKAHWNSWAGMADEKTVLEDVQKALQICRDKLGPKPTSQYKQTLWQCGLVVAQAFDESEDPDGEMHINHFMDWIGSKISGPKLKKAPENISPREKAALQKLRALLKQ